MSKTLLFEGAGIDNTGGNDVTNCRLRTRIKNKDGRIIYLEIGGFPTSKYSVPCMKRYKVGGHVTHCFYADREDDLKHNSSAALHHVQDLHYEYTQANIINLVNTELNCDFDNMVIDNDICVHDTDDQPLC